MPDTRSVTYRTPEELAALAEEVRTESHATIADHLGVSRSAVTHALSDPSSRRVRLLARILGLYGYSVDSNGPAYPVSPPP
jgi:transcriptional regulator with XRE-family HTH domain